MKNIIFFNKDLNKVNKKIRGKLGIKGRSIVDLAIMSLPISPGFIIDSELTKKLPQANVKKIIKPYISELENNTGKRFGDENNPLLLKIFLNSDLHLSNLPCVCNIGLNDKTVVGLSKFTAKNFAYKQYLSLLKNIGIQIYKLDEGEFFQMEGRLSKQPDAAELKGIVESYKSFLGNNRFSEDVYEQLELVLKSASSNYCDSEIDVNNSLSIIIQAMAYGNNGQNSYTGQIFTRNITTGDPNIQGIYVQNEFDFDMAEKMDISKIDKKYYDILSEAAKKIEDNFKEIRKIEFNIEDGKLWIVDQSETNKTDRAYIKTLLDLYKREIVSKKYIINMIQPGQLNELLHPVFDSGTIGNVKIMRGGMVGSTGVAIGRVYFSTQKLMEEYKRSTINGGDTNLILVMPSTYAEDVKAIEAAQGVITTEGGYADHAAVIARNLGKAAMVHPDIKIKGDSFTLDNEVVNEGDYVTIEVPFDGIPCIYLGKVGIIEPDFKENGLLDLLEIVETFIDDFDVRANADKEQDAVISKKFKAKGIGLCRTEHMFFDEKRIMKFREMIFAKTEKERIKALDDLRPMQRDDFYKIFKIMEGYPVTIRLLDAPLHEFLPRSEDEIIEYLQSTEYCIDMHGIRARCDELSELNPMLGHRGCRVAITYPEIYEMQCRAIFEAACMLKGEGIDVKPEIMIPIVMNEQEIKFIKNGKRIEGGVVKGIKDIKDKVIEEYGFENLEYSIGTMIELPAAALNADRIAEHAEFLSFGTNDLTQTVFGISRNDSNSFLPNYFYHGLMQYDPFKVLGQEVKELIETASFRGRQTMPDIKLGLCGEHGAYPGNIEFCMSAGLNYVSCSPYYIPLAKLAIAKNNLTAGDCAKENIFT